MTCRAVVMGLLLSILMCAIWLTFCGLVVTWFEQTQLPSFLFVVHLQLVFVVPSEWTAFPVGLIVICISLPLSMPLLTTEIGVVGSPPVPVVGVVGMTWQMDDESVGILLVRKT